MAYFSVRVRNGGSRLALAVLGLLSVGCCFASEAVSPKRSLSDSGSHEGTGDGALAHLDKGTPLAAGVCQTVRHAGRCTCSLPTIETELSFGEAAGIIELYFYDYPDESYVELLTSLFRQCSGALPDVETSPPIVFRQDDQSAASAR
jgi:hypothetical protein